MDEHTVTLRPPVWAIFIAVLIASGAYIWGKNIETRDHAPAMIVVTGEGKMSAAPDIAELSFGMQTGPQSSAKVALSRLSDSMNAVIASVKKLGIDEKDIRTQSLYMSPVYDYTDGRQVLRGYQATESLVVKVRDLDKVGDVLTAATAAGANEAGGVNFRIDNPDAVQAQAREKAITQAKEKARVLAGQLQMSLGKVKAFSEGGGVMPPMPMMARAEMGMASDMKSVPVPAGEQEVNVQVTITYELK